MEVHRVIDNQNDLIRRHWQTNRKFLSFRSTDGSRNKEGLARLIKPRASEVAHVTANYRSAIFASSRWFAPPILGGVRADSPVALVARENTFRRSNLREGCATWRDGQLTTTGFSARFSPRARRKYNRRASRHNAARR